MSLLGFAVVLIQSCIYLFVVNKCSLSFSEKALLVIALIALSFISQLKETMKKFE